MGCCFKSNSKQIYRSGDRLIFGVCQGFAEHFDLSVVWIRLGMIAAFVLTGFFPVVILYFVAALIMKPRPVQEQGPEEYFEEDFYDTSADPRTLSLRRLKSRYDAIEARIRRMENYVTNKSYDWERRFHSGQ